MAILLFAGCASFSTDPLGRSLDDFVSADPYIDYDIPPSPPPAAYDEPEATASLATALEATTKRVEPVVQTPEVSTSENDELLASVRQLVASLKAAGQGRGAQSKTPANRVAARTPEPEQSTATETVSAQRAAIDTYAQRIKRNQFQQLSNPFGGSQSGSQAGAMNMAPIISLASQRMAEAEATEQAAAAAYDATPYNATPYNATPQTQDENFSEPPAVVSESGDWREALANAIRILERQGDGGLMQPDSVGDLPGATLGAGQEAQAKRMAKTRQAAQLRLLYLAAGRPDDAAKPIAEDDDPESNFWQYQSMGIAAMLDPTASPIAGQRTAVALSNLRTATDQLSEQSNLVLRNLTFCNAAKSFGNYQPYDRDRFKPGEVVLLYVELENFKVEQKRANRYDEFETEFHTVYEIFGPDNKSVASGDLAIAKELCRNRRHDYFVAYEIQLPTKVTDGQYNLVLSIKDLKQEGAFFVQSGVDFEIDVPTRSGARR